MKQFTMKNPMSSWSKCSAAIGSMLVLAFFAACGDDVTDNDPVTTQGYESEEAFPKCDADYEGYFATLLSSQDVYICTAKNWVNISKAGSNAGTSSKTSCTAEELSDGTGVEITCNGKKSVLQYGKQGAQGDPGKAGSNAENGKAGEPGGKGKDGDDAVPDADRCFVKYETGDVVLFECGDSTYVRSMANKTTYPSLTFDVWNTLYVNRSYYPSWNGYFPQTLYNDVFDTRASGSLVRWEGDDEWDKAGTTLGRKEVYKNLAFAGTAKVTVSEAIEVTADSYRPFVGIEFRVKPGTNIADVARSGGFCLTYSSDSAMALLLKGDSGYVKAEIPATENGAEAVVDISIDDFEPVTDSVNVHAVMGSMNAIYVEAVGGEAQGEYSNKFAVHQFGSYGGCNSNTFSTNAWVTHVNSVCTPGEPLVDKRGPGDSVVYKTATIGNLVWMAENLRFETEESECYYAGDDANCTLYGRKYNGADADTACPAGWRLPSISEWGSMVKTVMQGSNSDGSMYKGFATTLAFSSENSKYGGKNLSGLNIDSPADTVYNNYRSSTDSVVSGTKEVLTFRYVRNSSGDYVTGDNPVSLDENYRGYWLSWTSKYRVRCVKDAE